MKDVTLEDLVRVVVGQVVAELKRSGMTVIAADGRSPKALSLKTERLDVSRYKSALVTEAAVRGLHELTGTLIVPKGTLVTPRARELLSERKINLKDE